MITHFTNIPELAPVADGHNWRVAHAFGFYTPRTGMIAIPAGFVTDLASVPKLFWNILPPFGKYTTAAIVHDWLYRTQIVCRDTADRVLMEAMRASRVPRWQQFLIYGNVRLFGSIAWNDDTRHLKSRFTHPVSEK